MTEKRFIPIFDGIDKRVVGAKDNGEIISFMDMFDLLNEQEETIQDLKTRNNRQYERLKELGDLMFKRDWETLNDMVDEWEKEEEQLRKYGG